MASARPRSIARSRRGTSNTASAGPPPPSCAASPKPAPRCAKPSRVGRCERYRNESLNADRSPNAFYWPTRRPNCDDRRKRATDAPLYINALRELEKRKGKRLDFEKSLSIILQAAKKARFLSYRELADANGADLSQVRYAIGGHLWKLAEYGHLKEQLLLSAIVMNKPNVETGKM